MEQRKISAKSIIMILLDIILTVCCILVVPGLKWKFLSLICSVIFLLQTVSCGLEEIGRNRQADRVRTANKVLFTVFMLMCVIALVGSFVGLWSL